MLSDATLDFSMDGPLPLHKATYKRIMRDFNHGEPLPLTLTTYSGSCRLGSRFIFDAGGGDD